MSLLTDNQKNFLNTRKIKVDGIYMFPRFGFTVYEKPDLASGEFVDNNPFTKSLDNETFQVKEVVDGFCKGNFYRKPHYKDFYVHVSELARRDFVERLFLYMFTWLPMVIYNLFRKEPEVKLERAEIYNVEKFNDWWNNPNKPSDIYAHAGIFLRTDKLSSIHIVQYFDSLGINGKEQHDNNALDSINFMDDIRRDWIKRRHT